MKIQLPPIKPNSKETYENAKQSHSSYYIFVLENIGIFH